MYESGISCPTEISSCASSIIYLLCMNLDWLLSPRLSLLICKRDIIIVANSIGLLWELNGTIYRESAYVPDKKEVLNKSYYNYYYRRWICRAWAEVAIHSARFVLGRAFSWEFAKAEKRKQSWVFKSEGIKDTKQGGVTSLECWRKDEEFSVVSTEGGIVGNKRERQAVGDFQAGEWLG